MTGNRNPEKKVDLPPHGRRNADPFSDAPGAHPIETGIGAALGGAAAGAAAGAFTGPVGTAVGAVVGAVAGGYAGKGVGEMIDPTTEDTWLRENFASRPYVQEGDTFEKYRPAYQYGGAGGIAPWHGKVRDDRGRARTGLAQREIRARDAVEPCARCGQGLVRTDGADSPRTRRCGNV